MLITDDDIEQVFKFGSPTEVRLRSKDSKFIRIASVTPQKLHFFHSNRLFLTQRGIVHRSKWQGRPGEMEFAWWLDRPVLAQERAQEALEASKATESAFEVPMGSGIVLRPFQAAGVDYMHRRKAFLLADEMGLGKTLQVVGVINCLPKVHRVLIICPKAVRNGWWRELNRGLVKKRSVAFAEGSVWPTADIVVIHYEIAFKFEKQITEYMWDMVVIDECFPAGTMVNTPSGKVPIESIRLGDTVLNAAGAGTVRRVFNRKANQLVRVRTTKGDVVCTPSHPFLTNQGWVQACNLNQSHYLITRHETMRVLRGSICPNVIFPETLQSILLGEMEDAATGDPGEALQSSGPSKAQRVTEEGSSERPFICGEDFQEDEAQESNGQPGNSSSSDRNASGAWSLSFGARRQWNRPIQSGDGSHGIDAGDGVELLSGHQGQEAVAASLQDRLGTSFHEDSRGSGWEQSLRSGASSSRQEEGSEAQGAWVVGVESLEQEGLAGYKGGCGGIEVYNLEVSGHPSYVIEDGIVVHNCHKLRNRKARMTRTILGARANTTKGLPFCAGVPGRIKALLTGTPIANTPMDLFPYLRWADKDFWGSYTDFEREYSLAHDGHKRLHVKLREWGMLRRLKKDVLKDLPDKTRHLVVIDAHTPEQLAVVSRDRQLVERHSEDLKRVMAEKDFADDVDGKLIRALKIPANELSAMRRATAEALFPDALEQIQDILESKDKLVVYAHHRDIIHRLVDALKEFSPVHNMGGISSGQLAQNITTFQKDPRCRVFVASITATGTGVDGLQEACSTCLFVEDDWLSVSIDQAEDRLHRIGQHSPLDCYHMALEGSIGIRILKVSMDKRRIADRVVDGSDAPAPDAGILEPKVYKPRSLFGSRGRSIGSGIQGRLF